jgi:hypothetical protein
MTRPMPPSTNPSCRILATAPHRPVSVYPGVYQSAIEIQQSKHPCRLQPDFSKQVQNIE